MLVVRLRANTYRGWPSYVTAAAQGRGVAGTPTVIVDTTRYR
jgi:2-hydroxychromene-2-carboxylate isomerase